MWESDLDRLSLSQTIELQNVMKILVQATEVFCQTVQRQSELVNKRLDKLEKLLLGLDQNNQLESQVDSSNQHEQNWLKSTKANEQQNKKPYGDTVWLAKKKISHGKLCLGCK